MGEENLLKLYNDKYEELHQKMPQIQGKQLPSLTLLLVSDYIATKSIFEDENFITMEEACAIAKSENEVCDNLKCYQELVDYITMNRAKFDYSTSGEHWGILDGNMAIMYRFAFDKECRKLGYAPEVFLRWALREGLTLNDNNRLDKNKKLTTFQKNELGKSQIRSPNLIAFNNGIIDVASGKFLDFDKSIEKIDVQQKADTDEMVALRSKANALVGLCSDEQIRKLVEKLAEDFRYSDPVSNEAVMQLEAELKVLLNDLQEALVDGNAEAAEKLCGKCRVQLAERNRICRLNK